MKPTIEALATMFAQLESGHVPVAARTLVPHTAGTMVISPALWPDQGAACVKVTTLTPGNVGSELPLIHGTVLLIDLATGQTRAALDGAALTALRTGAVAALATSLLADPDADDLGLVGAGAQAQSILRAVNVVRPLARVRIASRSGERAERLRAWAADVLPTTRVELVSTVAEAVRDASLIATATSTGAVEPLVRAEWITPGAHVNVIGGTHPGAIELDPEALRDAFVVVEHESVIDEGIGEIAAARARGIPSAARPLGLGAVASNLPPTGTTTIFRSVGLPAEDVAAAVAIYGVVGVPV